MTEHLFTSLPAFVCAVCAAFAVLRWRCLRTSETAWFAAFMITTATLYACHYLFFNHARHAAVTDSVYSLCNLLVYPLYFIYLSRLAVEARKPLPGAATILAPSLLVGAAVAAIYAAMDAEQTATFVGRCLYGNHWTGLHGLVRAQAVVHLAAKALFAVQVAAVLVVGSRLVSRHDRYVLDNYADTDGRTLATLHSLLAAFVLTSLVSFAANIVGRATFAHSVWLLAIPSTVFTALLFAVAWNGLTLSSPPTDRPPAYGQRPAAPRDSMTGGGEDTDNTPSATPASYTGGNESETNATASAEETDEQQSAQAAGHEQPPEDAAGDEDSLATLTQRIHQLLLDERLYLQHDLRIAHLAQQLHTNRTYIYQAVNGKMGVTFSELVNRMRIDHARELMREQPSLTVSEVANKSGYQSVASFYRNFKLYAGCTPTEFAERNS